MKATRAYVPYTVHELRQHIIHTSDDRLTILKGDVSLVPGKDAEFIFTFPKAMKKKPSFNLRFIPKDKLQTFIDDCDDGNLDIPENFDTYDPVDITTKTETKKIVLSDNQPGQYLADWDQGLNIKPTKENKHVEIEEMTLTFKSTPKEGAYMFYVDTPVLREGANDYFTVAVYNKKPSTFPKDDDDDLSDILNLTVNLSTKNGYLWFVHPIYYCEQLLNIKLTDDTKEEMASCEGLHGMTGMMGDFETTKLQWGYTLDGIKKFRLDVDKDTEYCVETDNIQVTKPSERFEFDAFKKGGL